MAEQFGEKTESATPRRRQEAREEGKVARSADLTAACGLLAAVLLLEAFGFRLLTGMKLLLAAMLSGKLAENPTRATDLVALPTLSLHLVAAALLPIVVGILVVSLALTVGQVGFNVTTKPFEFDITKLSPLKGLKNLFSMRGWSRLGFSIAKVAVIGTVGYIAIHQAMPQVLRLSELAILPMIGAAADLVFIVALKLAVLLIIMGLMDYAYQRWQHEQDLLMTKQELKEEMKRMDGDPLVKQRRARVARQLAMQRTAQAVPKADVVVTNPTHFAVALKYDSKSMSAPRVIAKGADFLALRIRQIALANGVPLVERKEIARGLYHGVEVGQEIPPQFFSAVAEILAYVYRLAGRRSA